MKARLIQPLAFSALLLLTLAFQSVQDPPAAVPAVTLEAASGATIPFATQNGRAIGDVPAQAMELPHLVLYRNGALSAPDERTLIVQVSGIEVPPTGVTVTLELETQHGDPDYGEHFGQRIAAWRESRRIANPTGLTQTGVTTVFAHEFGESVASSAGMVATPTDYFRYNVTVTGADHPASDPLLAFSADYGLLMENQWIARLPAVQEASPGAAPDELVVYYGDMFPFQKRPHDPATWLPREDVTDYVGTELVPRMVEAYRVQTDEWGFPWDDEWTSNRPEEAERLTVALVDGQTWFHGWAPDSGHSGISIRVTGGENAAYDTLTDGLMSTFYHELFHNMQRNIQLHGGSDGELDGQDDTWQFFSEGTAVLASSVGQPGGQISQTLRARSFMFYANNLGLWGGKSRDLSIDFQEIDAYQAAFYWRFLYEQCGGMGDGKDPAAGMRVIRDALTALYSGDIVDIRSSTDLVGAVPEIIDQALVGSSCPFQTYEESLTALAGSVFGLRPDRGRCVECGFYAPYDQHQDLPLSTISFAGADHEYRGRIGSGYGMDLIEVTLDPATDGRDLTVEFYGAATSSAEFSVQLWQLTGSRADTGQRAATEILPSVNPDGHLVFGIPADRTAAFDRLGLIMTITRLDTQEASDSLGEYTIELRLGAGS